MFSRVVILASILALGAASSWAQDRRFEVGFGAGWTLSDGVEGDAILAGDGQLYNNIEPKDAFSYDLNLGFMVNENAEVGALFSQQTSKFVLGGVVDRELGDFNVDNYHGYFAYNFGEAAAKARFYLLVGLGATHYGSVDFTTVAGESRELGGETKFSTTWGAGMKFYPGDSFGIKLGVRWTPTYVKSDSEGWWCDPYWGCYVVGDSQYSNQFAFTGGVVFRF